MRRKTALWGIALAAALIPAPARAFVWPNVPDRIARALASNDPSERRTAAHQIRDLPAELAEPLVKKAISDPDDQVRIEAAAAAAQIKLKGAGDIVVPWLAEQNAKIRLAACEVILVSPTPRAVQALGRVLADPSVEVRLAAAHAMGASGSPDAVSPLLGHLDDTAPDVRGEVASALGRLADARAVLPLVSKVRDNAPEVRRRVARALGSLGDARAASALVLVLSDANLDVRLEAIRALGLIGSDDATLALTPLANGETEGDASAVAPATEVSLAVRQAALEALGRIGSPKAVTALIDALEKDRPALSLPGGPGPYPEGMRMPAYDALVKVGAPAVKPLIAHLRAAASARTASGAALALGQIGDPSAVTPIVEGMQRGVVPEVDGLRALASLKAPAALPSVLELLEDGDQKVRHAAVVAASAVLDPRHPDGRAVEPIESALQASTDNDERVALVDLLGRTGAPRVAPVLIGLAAVKTTPMKRAALSALGAAGASSKDIDACLLAALDDESPLVRSDAALSLSRVGSAATAPELLRRLVEAAEQDRGALGIALSGVMSRSTADDLAKRAADSVKSAPDEARDALIEGLGRMQTRAALTALVEVAKGGPDDRRKAAEALALQKDGVAALEGLAKDADPSVRASAVWSLGKIGGSSSVAAVAPLLADPDVSVAVNAAGALGRMAARLGDAKAVEPALKTPLCAALSDPRSYVRASALTSIGSSGIKCEEAAVVALLADDASEVVREAAARVLRTWQTTPAIKNALARCAADDRSATVAEACDRAPLFKPPSSATFDLVVFVVPDGRDLPLPRAPFTLVLPGGAMRAGIADRRGAVFESALPDGPVQLGVPAALAP